MTSWPSRTVAVAPRRRSCLANWAAVVRAIPAPSRRFAAVGRVDAAPCGLGLGAAVVGYRAGGALAGDGRILWTGQALFVEVENVQVVTVVLTDVVGVDGLEVVVAPVRCGGEVVGDEVLVGP